MADFTRRLLAFESQHDLFSLRIKGHRVWDYIRYAVWDQHLRRVLQYSPPPARGRASGLKRIVSACGLPFQQPPPRRHYDVVVVNYDRNRLFDGRRVNIQTYPFIKALRDQDRVLLLDPAPPHVDVEANYPCDVLRMWRYETVDRATARLIRYGSVERAALRQLGDELKSALDVRVDLLTLVEQYFSYQLRLFARSLDLLRRLTPRLLAYSDTAGVKGVIEAAHVLGICTVDIQHALVSDLNISYQYGRPTEAMETQSDVILTFGDYWHEAYQHPSRRLVAGFPYFEQSRAETYARVGPVRSQPEHALIVISDWLFSRETFILLALELSRALPDLIVYYKLRPEEYDDWRSRYPADFQTMPNLRVIDSDEIPLYDYFARCTWQVGINSTALYEGLGFDLITFVIKDGWYEEARRLYEGGVAFLVEGADDIVERVRRGDRPPAPLDMRSVFAPGSMNRMSSVLQDLVGEA